MIYSSETNNKIKIMIKCFGKNLGVMKFIEINKKYDEIFQENKLLL